MPDGRSNARPSRRKFDHDMAVALRAEGAKLTEIAALFGVAITAISKVTKHEPCPIDHRSRAARVHVVRAREGRLKLADERRKRVVLYRSADMQYRDIATMMKCGLSQVEKYAAGVKPRSHKGKKSAALAVKPKPIQFSVPDYVRAAGLVQDFRDFRRDHGEAYAEYRCRQLIAEASRP